MEINGQDQMPDLSLKEIIKDFYNRKMTRIVIAIWGCSLVFAAGCIYSGIKFFNVEDTRLQIMHAVIFMCCIQFICVLKIIAWQLISRNSILRKIQTEQLLTGKFRPLHWFF